MSTTPHTLSGAAPIRVFISSTFLDMHAERDIIVNVVFPSLRRRFRASGRELVDVDLRWGLTEEQARRGEIAGLCLAEIDRCRPFFLGLIGERLGWIPPADSFNPRLSALYPILKERPGRSITEIEFDYAALSSPEKSRDALFLLRKSTAADEGPTKALRDRVRASGAAIATYERPEDLAVVLEDLLATAITKRIESDAMPAMAPADRLHEAFAQERRRNYQDGGERLAALDRWAEAPDEPLLLIEGESGAGKSALIANWTLHHTAQRPADQVLSHFLGASNESAAPVEVMQRLVRLLRAGLGETTPVPSDATPLMSAFADVLRRAGGQAAGNGTNVIIALDGLDKLTDWSDLRWLPHPLPRGVKVMTSALSGRAHDELIAHGAVRQAVAPLGDRERRLMIETRLGAFAKTLDEPQLVRIASHPRAGSPIFLQTVINELRVFGHFEELDARVSEYLAASTIPDLFDRVLKRLEQECGAELTARILTLICLSRSGLEENALLAITGATKLDRASVLLRLGDGLWEHDGRLSPSHDYLTQAVQRRYLQTPQAAASARAALAAHFDPRTAPQTEWQTYLDLAGPSWIKTERDRTPQERDERYRKAKERVVAAGTYEQFAAGGLEYLVLDEEPSPPADLLRRLEEVPYQIAASGDAHALHELLTDLRWFNVLYDRSLLELRRYWAATGRSGHEAEADLRNAVAVQLPAHGQWTKRQWRLVWRIINFLKESAWAGDASLALMRKNTDLVMAVHGNASPSAFDALGNLAALENALGRKAEALAHLREVAEGHTAMLGDEHPHALISKADYASALRATGNAAEARDALEQILPKAAKVFGATAANTLEVKLALANAFHDLAAFDRAEGLREEVLREYRTSKGPDHPDTLEVMSAMAIALRQQGKHAAACDLHAKVLEKRRAVLGPDHPGTITSLAAYGVALISAKSPKAAIVHLREALSLASARGDCGPLARTAKRDLIDALLMTNELKEALSLEGELVAEFEAIGELAAPKAIEAMRSYGAGLRSFGRLAESKAILEKCLAVEIRRSGANSAPALGVQKLLAETLLDNNEPGEARKHLEQVVAAKSNLPAANVDVELLLLYARACYGDGQIERGRGAEDVVMAQWKATPDKPQEQKLDSLMRLGTVGRQRYARADYAGAEDIVRFILECEIRLFGAASPHVAQSKANLASILQRRSAAGQGATTNGAGSGASGAPKPRGWWPFGRKD